MNTRPVPNLEGDPTAPEVVLRDWEKAGKPLPPPVEILWGVELSEIDSEAYRQMLQIPKRKRKRRDDGDKPEPPATP